MMDIGKEGNMRRLTFLNVGFGREGHAVCHGPSILSDVSWKAGQLRPGKEFYHGKESKIVMD